MGLEHLIEPHFVKALTRKIKVNLTLSRAELWSEWVASTWPFCKRARSRRGCWIYAYLSHTGNCSQEQSNASLKQKWCLHYIFFCYIKLFPGLFSSFAHTSFTPTNTLSNSWQIFNVNISAPWRNLHKTQLLCKGEIHEAVTAPWWQFRSTQHYIHRTKKGNILTSSLSVFCHLPNNIRFRVSFKFQSFYTPVWNNSLKHIFTSSVQQVYSSHIFANFSSFWKCSGCTITLWGSTVAESENVFPGGDDLS